MIGTINLRHVHPKHHACSGALLLGPRKSDSLLNIGISQFEDAHTVNTETTHREYNGKYYDDLTSYLD